jgi:hypothetical protein
MKKLFPESETYIYQLGARQIAGIEGYQIGRLPRLLNTFIELRIDTNDLINEANNFFKAKLSEENNCESILNSFYPGVIALTKHTAFDLIATLIIMKSLGDEEDNVILDRDSYIENILSKLHPEIFYIETKYNFNNPRAQACTHDIFFMIDHFSYDIISDDVFMEKLFEKEFQSGKNNHSVNDYKNLFKNTYFKSLVTNNQEAFEIFLEKCIRTENNCNEFLPVELEKKRDLLRNNGLFLKYMDVEIRNDFDSVVIAIKSNPKSFEFVGEALNCNHELIKLILKEGAISIVQNIPNIDLIELCESVLHEIQDITDKWMLILDWVVDADDLHLSSIIPIEYYNDLNIMINLFTNDRTYMFNRLDEVPTELLNNREFCAEIMMHHGIKALGFFSDTLRNDLEMIDLGLSADSMIAVDFDIDSYYSIGYEIRESETEMKILCDRFPNLYIYASDEIKSDRALALNMIHKSPIAYRYLKTEFQTDPEFHEIFRNGIFNVEALNGGAWPVRYTERTERIENNDWLPF